MSDEKEATPSIDLYIEPWLAMKCAMIILSGFCGAASLWALLDFRSDIFMTYWALSAFASFSLLGIWTAIALMDGGDE